MKLQVSVICLLLIGVIFSQCNPSRRIFNEKDSYLVNRLLVFPVHSQIAVIEKGDKKTNDENLSSEAETEIKDQLKKFIPVSLSTNYLECKKEKKEEIIQSIIQLIKTTKSAISPQYVRVPDMLLNVLDSLGENYGLLIFQEGFTRTQKNLMNQQIKRRAIAYASLGIYDTTPNESYSVMIGVLIDKKNNRLSMYKELYFRNRDPNEEVVIRSQIRDIILSYFQDSN